jgi:hypothetical protein
MSGRQRRLSPADGPAALTSTSEGDAAFAAAFSDVPLSPAILAEDGRAAVTVLNEARDQAAVVAAGLDQLEAAGAGLARVQQLVGRLRDVAVVAVDRGLQPADRAALQRQVDLALSEIATVADETLVDDDLALKGAPAPGSGASGGTQATPFRAISTGALGIAGLAVRSPDQALAAAGALDVAAVRLERRAGTLGNATARLQDALNGLVSPTTTATGERAIGSGTAALSATMLLRAQLTRNPQEAARAQGGLEVSRVAWLLDASPR